MIMQDFARDIRRAYIEGRPARPISLFSRNARKVEAAKRYLGSLYVLHPQYEPDLHPEHNPGYFPGGSYVLHRWQRQRERDLMGVL